MSTALVWFRKSLRLEDNPALTEASSNSSITSLLPIFIIDPEIAGQEFQKYSPSRTLFLLQSLGDLDQQLRTNYNSQLFIFQGNPATILPCLCSSLEPALQLISTEYCSEPRGLQLSQELEKEFSRKSHTFDLSFHKESHTILDIEMTTSASDYKEPKSMKDIERIFASTFGKDEAGFFRVPDTLPAPKQLPPPPKQFRPDNIPSPDFTFFTCATLQDHLQSSNLLCTSPGHAHFKGGETEALLRLQRKVSTKKDFVNSFRKPKTASTNLLGDPLEPSTTGLSPYIATGCLSARKLWKEVEACNRSGTHTPPPESLHGQLLFREMFYLLSRSVENWDQDDSNRMCKNIKWGDYDKDKMTAWESGQTGFPLIDALMRQLEATGWMHHLARHAVSCFLTRGQLWQHWKWGRDIFERKLLDSDWALNNANWLWLSGVAPFSMPYFRLYNPCPAGKSSLNVETNDVGFIKHWVPELKDYPPKFIFEPHLAPLSVQEDAGCILGKDYPMPIVDRKESARENLSRFKQSLAA
jgi:cryptochrome